MVVAGSPRRGGGGASGDVGGLFNLWAVARNGWMMEGSFAIAASRASCTDADLQPTTKWWGSTGYDRPGEGLGQSSQA